MNGSPSPPPDAKCCKTQYSHLKSHEEQVTAAGEENVLFALENLRSYPGVEKRLKDGTLRLHGWFFKIVTARTLRFRSRHETIPPARDG